MLVQYKCENPRWAFVSCHIHIQLSRFSGHLISLGFKITEMWTYPRILETAPLVWILKSYVTLFWGYDIQDKTNQWMSSAGWRVLWTVLKGCFNRFLKKKWTKIKQPCLNPSFKDASFQDFAEWTWTRWLIITENSINEAE